MAFISRCCGCCELRIGVLIIGIVSIILAVGNIGNGVRGLQGIPEARDYVRDHPDDLKKYGLTEELFDTLQGFTIVGIIFSSLSLILSAIIIVPAAYPRREDGRKFRAALLPWLVLDIIGMVYFIVYMIWVFVKFTNIWVAAAILILCLITIPLSLYFFLCVLAFYIQLGEEVPQQVAVVPVVQGGAYPPQVVAYPPQGGAYPPQQYTGFAAPPPYMEKTGYPPNP